MAAAHPAPPPAACTAPFPASGPSRATRSHVGQGGVTPARGEQDDSDRAAAGRDTDSESSNSLMSLMPGQAGGLGSPFLQELAALHAHALAPQASGAGGLAMLPGTSHAGYRGVTVMAGTGAPGEKRWRVLINHNGKTLDMGTYGSELEAAKAYDESARKLHGDRARLNFPDLGIGERSVNGRSSFRGISWQAKCQKWEVRIKHEGKMRYVGVYADELVAATAWDIEALRLRGPSFRNLNFPDRGAEYLAVLATGKGSGECACQLLGVPVPDTNNAAARPDSAVEAATAAASRRLSMPVPEASSPACPPDVSEGSGAVEGAGAGSQQMSAYSTRSKLKRGADDVMGGSHSPKSKRSATASPASSSVAAFGVGLGLGLVFSPDRGHYSTESGPEDTGLGSSGSSTARQATGAYGAVNQLHMLIHPGSSHQGAAGADSGDAMGPGTGQRSHSDSSSRGADVEGAWLGLSLNSPPGRLLQHHGAGSSGLAGMQGAVGHSSALQSAGLGGLGLPSFGMRASTTSLQPASAGLFSSENIPSSFLGLPSLGMSAVAGAHHRSTSGNGIDLGQHGDKGATAAVSAL